MIDSKLQDLIVASMHSEVWKYVGAPTIKCMDPFVIRLVISTTAADIINGNLEMEAFAPT